MTSKLSPRCPALFSSTLSRSDDGRLRAAKGARVRRSGLLIVNGHRDEAAVVGHVSDEVEGSMAGVRYSTGMDASGGRRRPVRSSSPVRALYPTSRRVTVLMRTRPRAIRGKGRQDLGIEEPQS